MKSRPCTHPKRDRYVHYYQPSLEAMFHAGFMPILVTYCAKCGKKLREVEVKE